MITVDFKFQLDHLPGCCFMPATPRDRDSQQSVAVGLLPADKFEGVAELSRHLAEINCFGQTFKFSCFE